MKVFFYLVLVIALFAVSGCKKTEDSGKMKIITTIFPLYDFAREITGDKADVSMIIPPGTEPHSFEPTPRDIMKINEGAIFIYIGKEMEPWADDIIRSVRNEGLIVLEADSVLGMSAMEDHDAEEDGHGHGIDPHIWLDFEIDQKIVEAIAQRLMKADPSNADYYRNKAAEYERKLSDLDLKYKETLARCELKTIMYGGHFAFGYLARRYGLSHISPYEGFTPDAEPAPQKIAEMIDNIGKNKIKYLFYEELLDPKAAKAIADETKVKLELLNAAHNLKKEEISSGVKFIDIMEINLEKLKKGLKYR